MDIRKFPEQETRVETGPIQFGDDWPCTVIRGDHSFMYAMALKQIINKIDDPFIKPQLEGLLETLESCQIK